jgi:hypothetical protein
VEVKSEISPNDVENSLIILNLSLFTLHLSFSCSSFKWDLIKMRHLLERAETLVNLVVC